MSYQTGEAAILTLIQALDGFDADNTLSLANDSTRQAEGLLNSGRADRYVILRPGTFSRVYADIGASEVHTAWGTVNAPKGFVPLARRSSIRATWTGSEGTRKGSRVMTTHSSAFPFTSTPSQKLSVPKRAWLELARNCRRSWERPVSPWRRQ